MDPYNLPTFRSWLFAAVVAGMLAGFNLAVTITYLKRHVNLLDLPFLWPPLGVVSMALCAVASAMRVVRSYRAAIGARAAQPM